MGLDNRVWRVMISMIVLSAGLLNYKLMDNETCRTIPVYVKPISHHDDSTYYTDEIIFFNAPGPERTLTWDFDDNTPAQEGRNVTHRFQAEGNYNVKICKLLPEQLPHLA